MKKLSLLASVAALTAATAWAVPTDARRDACAARAREIVAKLTPEERVGLLMMDSAAVPRLGIERYHWWNEALHGIARAGLATVFPQSMGMAATFDAPLQERMGEVVSTETRAKYNLFSARGQRGIYKGLTLWSPNVNMFRDPRWGRGQETFGEDPYLSGVMGGAYVRGLQGSDTNWLKTAACAKHFAVHSGPEKLRHGFNAKVSKRDLAEYYLPAFRALAVDYRVEAFMGAYSALNGTPCCASRELLTDTLRGAWGFRGHIVSDVGAIGDINTGHHFAADKVAASKAAIAAGLDLCSEGTYACLRDALKEGRVKSEELEEPLVHLLTTRLLLGQLDPKGSTPWDYLDAKDVATAEHRRLALEAAEKSLVLVSNNGTLPYDPLKADCIGVVGPRAMDEIALLGNYCGYNARPVSVFSGVTEEAGAGVRIIGVPEGGHGSDLAIVCLGITAEDEGEEGCSANNMGGDRASYSLPAAQLKLLESYRKSCKKVVAVVFGGSPFDLAPVAKNADAVILAWYPGELGGKAIARAIFGRCNPAGRLPITYPKSYADLPDFADYALEGRTYRYATKAPAYPFGYGLSYTKFAYSNLKVEKTRGGVDVTVEVRNVGGRAGDEVVQLYVRAPEGAGDRRLHHLEGFARVSLAAGESRVVKLFVSHRQLAVFGEDGVPFVPKGETTVFVGGGQPGFAKTLEQKVAFSFVTEPGSMKPHWHKGDHVQGIACAPDAVYLGYQHGILKYGWDGRLLGHVDAPHHTGDVFWSDGRLYTSVDVLEGPRPLRSGVVQVYDADLRMLASKDIPQGVDGVCVRDGIVYLGMNNVPKLHRVNQIGRMDAKTLEFLGRVDIDYGHDTSWGTQDITTDGENFWVAFYSKKPLAVFDRDWKLLRTLDLDASNGLDVLPKTMQGKRLRFARGTNSWSSDPSYRIDFFEFDGEKMVEVKE